LSVQLFAQDVDGPHKDDSHKRFRKDFKFEMGYEEKEADQRHVVYNEDIEHRVMQRLYEKVIISQHNTTQRDNVLCS
jgi:hypothetical protein